MVNKIVVVLMLCATSLYGYSQEAETPVDHMTFFTNRDGELSLKYLSYMSEAAHGKLKNAGRKLYMKSGNH